MFELCLCLYWQPNNRLEVTANSVLKNDCQIPQTSANKTMKSPSVHGRPLRPKMSVSNIDLTFEIAKVHFQRKPASKYWQCISVLSIKYRIYFRLLDKLNWHFLSSVKWYCQHIVKQTKSAKYALKLLLRFKRIHCIGNRFLKHCNSWHTVCQY